MFKDFQISDMESYKYLLSISTLSNKATNWDIVRARCEFLCFCGILADEYKFSLFCK